MNHTALRRALASLAVIVIHTDSQLIFAADSSGGEAATPSSTEKSAPLAESKSKDRHRDWHWSFTSKVLAGLVYEEDGHSEGVIGFGGQIDIPLVEHELEIEIGGTYHREHTLSVLSAEMLLAHVFDAGRYVQPYVGVGPVFFLMDGKIDAAFQTSVGTNLWTRGHWGAHIETNYVRVFAPNLDEISAGLGVSFRY